MLLPLPGCGKPSVRSPCAYLLIKFYNFYLFFVLYFQQSLCSLCSSWPGTIPRPRGLPGGMGLAQRPLVLCWGSRGLILGLGRAGSVPAVPPLPWAEQGPATGWQRDKPHGFVSKGGAWCGICPPASVQGSRMEPGPMNLRCRSSSWVKTIP